MALNVLEQIASTPGKNDKIKILEDNVTNSELAELLDAVFNYHRKFYTNKIAMPDPHTGPEHNHHEEFIKLLLKLETRMITGNDAKYQVESFFKRCTKFQQKWYARVLRKDLKAKVSAKTVVKAGFSKIPLFDVMLAKDGKLCKKLDEIINKGVYVSPKYDGYRCLAVVNNGTVTLFSRNGTVYSNFPTITESLSSCFPKGQFVFDGEIMSDGFQAMQKSAFANKRGTTVGDVKYHVFGYVPYDEWTSLDFKMKTKQRLSELDKLAKQFDDNLLLVHQEIVTSKARVLELEMEYIDQGFEGAMALPDIPYYLGKKSNKLLKFKTMESQDCEIIGFYEGKPDTRHRGSLGGFIVKQENGKTARGDGCLTDDDRRYIWDHQEEFLGRIGEFKYQELTPDDVMRFPKFFRWRDLGSETGKI